MQKIQTLTAETIQGMATDTSQQLGQVKPIGSLANSSKTLTESTQGICNSDRASLIKLLQLTCVGVKKYGTKPEELQAIADSYLFFLRGYTPKQLNQAIYEHVTARRGNEIPSVADLLDILNPKQKIISTSMYNKLCEEKKNDKFMTRKELDAIKHYEINQLGEM